MLLKANSGTRDVLAPAPAFRSRVIAVASGKGGVGKTNVAVNVGLALARRGVRVALVDADTGTANVDVVLGIHPRYHLHHVVSGQCSLAEIIVEGPDGLLVVPGASGLPELADLPDAQREMLLRSLLVLDGMVDLLLIDVGAGVGQSVVQWILAAGELLLVTSPEPTAILDAYALMKVLANYDLPVTTSLVVNGERARREGEITGERLAALVQHFLARPIRPLGTLPHDPCIPDAVRKQAPLLHCHPQAPAARAIERLSERLWGDALPGRTPQPASTVGRFFRALLSPLASSPA